MYEDLYKIAKENDLDMVKADFYRFTRNPENGNMNLVYNHLDLTGKWYGKLFDPSEEPETLRFIMIPGVVFTKESFWSSITSDITKLLEHLSRTMVFISRLLFMQSVR